jgi:hypothetical protein
MFRLQRTIRSTLLCSCAGASALSHVKYGVLHVNRACDPHTIQLNSPAVDIHVSETGQVKRW